MPHVTIRWRSVPGLTQEDVEKLSAQIPFICAYALSIPNGRQYKPEGIVVKVDKQSEMDKNITSVLIEVFATGSPEQIARRDEAREQIIEGIRTCTEGKMRGSVWLLLPQTSFSVF